VFKPLNPTDDDRIVIMSHPMSSELPGNMIEKARGECLHFDDILVDQSDAG
jgi:hypothetical protein